MQGDQIEVLVQQAAAGNAEAFSELVFAFGRDLRLMIAAHVGTAAALGQLETAVWSAARQQLGQYRGEIPFADWLVGLAASPIVRHLEEVDRVAVYAKDALGHQIAQESLAALEDRSEHGVRELPGRVEAMPETTRMLLLRHYRERQSVAAIATSQVVGESEIASALAGARAACDWRGIAKPPAVSDRLLPSLTEDWFAGTIDPDSLGLLAANLARDLDRGVQFARQVRVHFALAALLAPFGRDEARALGRQAWGGGNDNSSRLMVAPGPSPRAATSARPPASDGRRPARKQSSAHHPLATDDDESRPSPLPWIIAGILVVIGVGSLIAMNMRGGAVAPRPPAQSPVQAGTLAPAQAAGIGRVLSHAGDAGLVRQGSRLSTTDDQPLQTGDGAVCVGPGALLSLSLEALGRIDLRGDSTLGAVGRKDGAWMAHLGSGRLAIDVERAGSGGNLTVLTPEARIEIAAAACLVTTGNGRTDVEVTRGTVRLVRPGDGQAIEVPTGRSALLAERGAPTLTGGGVFARGINLGGDSLAVERNPWLSQRQAEAAGLTLDAGAKMVTAEIPANGLDVESRAMLANGITASDGTLRLVQAAADGDYEATLWIAGGSADGLALRLGGQSVAVGRPTAGGASWSRLGPFRVTARNRAVDIALGGLRGQHLAGLALAAIGPGDGALPPLVSLLGIADGGHAYVGRGLMLRAELSSAAGITRVEFWNGATKVGEATASPWQAPWTPPAAGAVALTARAFNAAGAATASLPVNATAIAVYGSGKLRREWWTGVDGLRVSEAVKNPAFAGAPQGQADESEFSARRDWGDSYLQRLSGFVIPPLDGDYVFWIAADDDGELWLSEDDTPARRRRIAIAPMVEGNGINFAEWERDQRQRSEPVRLQAGRRYFVEVLHKEAGGNDHVEVGWRLPDGVLERPIPGVHLSPPTTAPSVVRPPVIAGGEVRPDLMLWDGETRGGGGGYGAGGFKAEPDAGRGGGVGVRTAIAVGFANIGWNWHAWNPDDGGTDLREFQALTFWMRIDGANRPANASVGLVSSPKSAQRRSALADVAKLVPDFADGKWHQVVVPMSAFAGADFDPLKVWEINLKLTGSGTLDCTLALDEIGVLRALPGAAAVAAKPSMPVVPAPPAAPRFITGINLGGDPLVIDGNKWMGHKQAEESAGTPGVQVVALSDIEWTAAQSANGDVHKNLTWENKPLTLRGVVHPKGLGVHAASEITYALAGRYAAFMCDVGIDDETGGRGSATFRVLVDGQLVFDSGVLTHGSPAKKVNVPVSGGKELKLVVTDGGNGNDWDHADWAGARLLRAGVPGGLVVKSGRKTVGVMNPKPAVDAVMRGMLTTSLVGTSKEGVAFNVRVPPGTYQVYLWTVETSIANARLFEVELEGESCGEIGALPAAGWAKYGPFPVIVEDGELNVATKPKKGVPQLMGIAIFEPPPPPPEAIPPPAPGDLIGGVAEAKDFRLVYQADLAQLAKVVTYEVDDSAKITGAFDRIGYFLELQRPGGEVEWVWTAMDAFTTEVNQIAIPTLASNATFQQLVNNLTVESNVKDLATGAVGTGAIEFWPHNYAPANTAKVEGASDTLFDFGDQRTEPRDGYGCMQVHNLAAKQTVFALNHWVAGAAADLGVGNGPGDKGTDWTFSSSARGFALKKLRIYVRPKR